MGKKKNKKKQSYIYDEDIKKKKKKKKQDDRDEDEFDLSDINADEDDFRNKMKGMANSLQCYLDYIDTYAIFDGISEEEWKKNVKIVKKLIKKLRMGDTSVFDIPTLNEVLSQNNQLIIGLEE